MYIVEVIPITSLPPQVPQLLSYYFSQPLLKGAVVEVLIGSRKVVAAVVSSVSVEEQKASLKKSDFQLKKISGVISETPLVSDIQFKIALWLSGNYFAPLGLCLKTVLPAFFLKKYHVSSSAYYRNKDNDQKKLKNHTTHHILHATVLLSRAKDIIKNIEPEIKKTIQGKKQVLLVVPEISTAKYFHDRLTEYYKTTIIHSKIFTTQLYKDWKNIHSGDVEIIIGTRQALFSPFSGLGLVIVEDSANEAYKSDMSPKYNTADLAKKIADLHSASFLSVSQVPDITGYHFIKKGGYFLTDKRSTLKPEIKFEDMLQEIKSGNFSVFSRGLKNSLEEYLKENRKVLIFSTRKGYYSYLVCGNCGFHFNCPNCSIPFKVHKFPEQLLTCRRCSTSKKIPDSCPSCHSYKLKSSGFAGSERIKEELVQMLDNKGLKKEIVVLDSDSSKNLIENKSAIYIATQSIFSRRFDLSFDIIGIPNLDGLTTTPDFRAEENLFLQFEKLLDFNPEVIIGQTYNPDTRMLGLLKKGNYQEFYEKELPSRKLFGYPPFTRLIKLSCSSPDKNKADYEAKILSEKLKMAVSQRKLEDKVKLIGPSSAFVEKEKNRYIYNIVLKISPDQSPGGILRFVPSHWRADIDPKSIL